MPGEYIEKLARQRSTRQRLTRQRLTHFSSFEHAQNVSIFGEGLYYLNDIYYK